MCHFHDDLSHFFRIYKNLEVAKCFHGYRNYAPHSDITRYPNICTIPSSSRICVQISFTYPALPKPLSSPLFSFCLSTIKFPYQKLILSSSMSAPMGSEMATVPCQGPLSVSCLSRTCQGNSQPRTTFLVDLIYVNDISE